MRKVKIVCTLRPSTAGDRGFAVAELVPAAWTWRGST